MIRTSRLGQAGDTIVEVMLAILVAGVALAVAYQLSNASLRTSTQAVQRSQALSYGSAQLEIMKNCYYVGPPLCYFDSQYQGSYGASNDFCIITSGGGVAKVPFASDTCGPSATPPPFDIFTVRDDYDGPTNGHPPGTNTFKITVSWPNINGHGQDQQVLYYRFPQ